MAFRLPTQAPPRHQASYSTAERPSLEIQPPAQQTQDDDDDSKEWVLFSPSQAASTTRTRTRTDSTERTARTAGLSRLSDFGSFNATTTHEGTDDNISEEHTLDEEDTTELDSLDEGLHHFRESNLPDNSNPVLPTHDGLGSFHASGQLAQHQLWQFEQYNPQRQANIAHTRRSSVQKHLETVDEQESEANRERWQRIEKWRTEQSRILLQEIERETRRRQRRNSRASLTATSRHSGTDILDSISETNQVDVSTSSSSTETSSTQGDSPEESFWRRITRKVIRDLIGINDSILSVILGESLVEDTDSSQAAERESQASTAGIEDAIRDVPITGTSEDNIWQEKLVQRIARELGILVHQIWEHPGAFSTYRRVENPADYYAGIPVNSSESASQSRRFPQTQSGESNAFSTISPHFTPTLRDPATVEHAAQWGIEDDETGANQSSGPREPLSESARLNQEFEYWERDLDIAMVFRYLKNRFRKSDNGSSPASRAMYREQDASSRAAVIRQHHPLVARAHARSQARQSTLRTQFHAAGIPMPSSPISRHRFRRPSSSCASQSTKISAKRLGSGSSRHYWDIGGSVGSGSAAVAGVGTWGEV